MASGVAGRVRMPLTAFELYAGGFLEAIASTYLLAIAKRGQHVVGPYF